jgi:hypothetical protein
MAVEETSDHGEPVFDLGRVASPLLRRFHAHWSQKRGERAMPAYRDFDPLDFAWALGKVSLIDVEREPLRFRYRLVGSEHVARLGVDMTGKLVDDFASPAIRRILQASYAQVVEQAHPIHRLRWTVVAGLAHHYEALLLPLSEAPPQVDMVAVCAEYLDAKRR